VIKRAVAQAQANIALIKYWGKRGPGNSPATPSIGLCLEALTTTTCIERSNAKHDSVKLDGKAARGAALQRVVEYLDIWRGEGLIEGRFRIDSSNNFPTAAGLASSSSGFAALAKGLSAFSKQHLSVGPLSRLARLGSGSAARSIPGGIACLPTGIDPSASLLVKPAQVGLAMAVCIVDAAQKEVSSREGMARTQKTSPFSLFWGLGGVTDYEITRTLLKNYLAAGAVEWPVQPLQALGEVMEDNCCAMHACMLAAHPPLIYWAPGTLAVIQAVRKWRASKLQVFFTIDAGPHVALLCRACDLRRVAQRAAQIPGVMQVIPSLPGGSARIIEKA
jgi:diphosphomevalonate decarboxylase